MRTTLTLDDDVAALLDEVLKRRKTSLKAVVNDALRRGLSGPEPPTGRRKHYRVKAWDLGPPRIDLDNVWEAVAFAEGETFR